ncbi:MAG TPA: hypothetical protein VF396_00900 [Bradyrhizobium sp.]
MSDKSLTDEGEAIMAKDQSKATTTQTVAQTPAGAATAKPAGQQSGTFHYVDRPECMETFADSITGLSYDGQTLRIEFGITRADDIKPNTPVTGRRYPACRLVLSPIAAIDLINKMQQIATALAQAGLVKPMAKPAEPGNVK